MRLRKFYLLLLFFLLTGCATFTQPSGNLYTSKKIVRNQNLSSLNSFEAIGKIGFSDGKQGGNASFVWKQQSPENYQIRLYGPLGSGAIQIQSHGKKISLTQADGKIMTARTPEDLVHTALGWIIPVSGLRYWLRGLPAPGAPPTQMLDTSERLWQMHQQGWTIQYLSYKSMDNLEVPHKLLLKNGSIRLKFIFDRWRFN